MLRVIAVLVVVVACSDEPAGERSKPPAQPTATAPARQVFKCRKSGFQGGPWRECAPDISRCDEYGCFERDEAFCFPVRFMVGDEGPHKQWTICAPTERECEEWNQDRKGRPNGSLGPCVRSRPDEYVDLK